MGNGLGADDEGIFMGDDLEDDGRSQSSETGVMGTGMSASIPRFSQLISWITRGSTSVISLNCRAHTTRGINCSEVEVVYVGEVAIEGRAKGEEVLVFLPPRTCNRLVRPRVPHV